MELRAQLVASGLIQVLGNQPIRLPTMEEQLNVLAVAVVVLGVLLFLINRLRQRADKRGQVK